MKSGHNHRNQRPCPTDGLGLRGHWLAFFVWLTAVLPCGADEFGLVQAVFKEHCLDCHAAQDPEGKLALESFETLMRGGASGAAIVPGKSDESRLVRMIEGTLEKDGRKKIMPPGNWKKLDAREIALVKGWIDAGALAPASGPAFAGALVMPKIAPQAPPRHPIHSLAYAAGPDLLAVATDGEVVLRSAATQAVLKSLAGHPGNVNAVVFNADGSQLFAACGENARFGEVYQWNVKEGKVVKTFHGHQDALYALALSPDGQTLATGSYDQKIKLWDVATGKELKTLSGHNGSVYGVAFRPDGKVLASASADRTVKLWDVATGERLDTLAQSLKELYTVQFSPDGKILAAPGVDNRIRAWAISEKASETTNPLMISKFAHEGSVLGIVFSSDGKLLASSADDKTVRLWETGGLKERLLLPPQPDWLSALAFATEDKTLVVGCLDGTLEFYESATGKPMAPAKPELVRMEPRGFQIGVELKVKLKGKYLGAATGLHFSHPQVKGELLPDERGENELGARVSALVDLPRGTYEAWLSSPYGDSSRIKLYLDDLPQWTVSSAAEPHQVERLPANFWGVHQEPGESETFDFGAKSGQTMVFDVTAEAIGAKTEAVLTLTDATGRVLAGASGFDGGKDPLLACTFGQDGRYLLRVSELIPSGSVEHFYRLTMGALPYVTACFPLSVPVAKESTIELIGFNLEEIGRVKIKPERVGELDLAVDPRIRSRRVFKVVASDLAEAFEQEPNDVPEQATRIEVPGAVGGRIWSREKRQDADLFRFEAKAGQAWVIEMTMTRSEAWGATRKSISPRPGMGRT